MSLFRAWQLADSIGLASRDPSFSDVLSIARLSVLAPPSGLDFGVPARSPFPALAPCASRSVISFQKQTYLRVCNINQPDDLKSLIKRRLVEVFRLDPVASGSSDFDFSFANIKDFKT